SLQLSTLTDRFSSDITRCCHGRSCCGKTKLSDFHPMACNLWQSMERSHSVTT
ncbi:Hypothetical predicted protein, partial [Marmota monax]